MPAPCLGGVRFSRRRARGGHPRAGPCGFAEENNVPENQIVDRLLYVAQFTRLSPDRDPEAYALQLIEEEKFSFHALHSVVPLPPRPRLPVSDRR